MKEKIHYAIEAALAVAVIILFALQFTGSKKYSDTDRVISEKEKVSDVMPIAYVDIDSLAMTYTYSLELNDKIARKYEASQLTLAEQARKFQSEAEDFQRKIDMNIFATRERAEAEQQRILKKRDELQQLDAKLSQELDEERLRLQEEFRKTIIEQMTEYNKEKGYQIILSKTNDNILFANEVYNITTEVIEFLNLQYAKAPVLGQNE